MDNPLLFHWGNTKSCFCPLRAFPLPEMPRRSLSPFPLFPSPPLGDMCRSQSAHLPHQGHPPGWGGLGCSDVSQLWKQPDVLCSQKYP